MGIEKPNGYDNLDINTEFEPLPPGGYVCQILNAKEEVSKAGNPMVVVMLDIVEGEYKDYFRNLFKARKDASDEPLNVKYPFDGMDYLLPEWNGEPTKKFKGFNTSVEESGGKIIWGDKYCESIKGATVGIIFRRSESRGFGDNEDKTYWNTKPYMYRSTDSIRNGEFRVPEDKPLVDDNAQSSFEMPAGFTDVSDEDIPF